MIKTLCVYILVIAGIAAYAGISGAAHVTNHTLQQWEHRQ
jgi:hypothetical protein